MKERIQDISPGDFKSPLIKAGDRDKYGLRVEAAGSQQRE